MTKTTFLLPLSLIFLVACGPQTEPEIFDAAVGAQRMEKYEDAISLFERLLEEYPQAEKLPDAYYALGVLYQDQRKDFTKAIDMYTKLYESYPESPTASNALFMVGFLQHNELKDLEAARKTYGTFLERYPDSPLVASARFELDNLGKDASEVFGNIND